MDEPGLVSRGKPWSQLSAKANSFLHAEGAAGELHVQGYSRDVLSHEKISAALVPEFKNRGNVGVIKAGERQSLFSKTLTRTFLGEQAGEKHLERDPPFQFP